MRHKFLLPCLLFLTACGGSQNTEPEPIELQNSDENESSFETNYEHVHQHTLENGLKVVVVERPELPIITIEIAAHNGAFTEPPEFNGLSHLYEHMFFKANDTFPSQEAYMARQRELGMVWNGTTGNERVNYYFTLQSHNLRDGLVFMRDAIQTPRFLEEELVREREVVLGEFDRNEANPYYYLWHAMDDMLWSEYRSRKDSLGDRQTISTATVEQMRWMQETYYIPNNSLLVLAGDLTAETGFALAEELFADWEQAPDPFIEYPIPEHPPLTENTAVIVEQNVQVSVIQLGWHGPDTRNDVNATYAADVFSTIIAQTSSRFSQNLVESGLALQAYIGYSTQRYVGPITFTLVTLPGREQEAISQALVEISHFADPDYFTDEQLQTAQTLLAVSDLYGQQSTDQFAHTLSYWWASADIEYYLNYISSLSQVTRDDITNYIHTYITDQPYATVLLSNHENIAAQEITQEWILNQTRSEK